MGFSASAAFAILGVCLIASIDIFSSTVFPSISNLGNSYKDMEERIVDRANTDIEIINISTTTGIPYNLSIDVKNTGSTCMDVSDFTVLLNGVVKDFNYSKEYIYPQDTVFINITGISDTGENRVKIVTGNGISDYETYSV